MVRMKLLVLGLFLVLGLELTQAEDYSKCTGMRVGLSQVCSQLVELDCYNAGGQCCATNSNGTGNVTMAGKTSKSVCGYCFTGKPATLIEEAILEAFSTAQRKRQRNGRHGNKGTVSGQAAKAAGVKVVALGMPVQVQRRT